MELGLIWGYRNADLRSECTGIGANLRCKGAGIVIDLRSKGAWIGADLRCEGGRIGADLRCKGGGIEAALRSEGVEIGVDLISNGEGTATDLRVQKTFFNACKLTQCRKGCWPLFDAVWEANRRNHPTRPNQKKKIWTSAWSTIMSVFIHFQIWNFKVNSGTNIGGGSIVWPYLGCFRYRMSIGSSKVLK